MPKSRNVKISKFKIKGSSGGEGVLVASAGSLFGIGNDIGGSVRIPAYMNGIFGQKPTSFPNHTIPVDGILPKFTDYQPASEMLTMGPLVRYASDLPLIMSASFFKLEKFGNY